MNTETIFFSYERHTHRWIRELDRYDSATFFAQPSENEWSMSQVYDHLINVSEECIRRANDCINNDGEKGHSGFGPALFSRMGSFPPVKLRVKEIPAGLEHIYRPRKISIAEAEKGLVLLVSEMKALIPLVAGADKNMRIRHWAGGWFNAAQWYHSAEMHLKHHFRQKRRVDRYLAKQRN